jgi:hypothetical protein
MHGLLVRVNVNGEVSQYEQMFVEYGTALNSRDGFIMKTWIIADSMVGGFYIFADQASAQSYIDEMLFPSSEKSGAFSVESIEHFTVVDELSELTGSPAKPVSLRT